MYYIHRTCGQKCALHSFNTFANASQIVKLKLEDFHTLRNLALLNLDSEKFGEINFAQDMYRHIRMY